jgi:hypothetical protein
LASDQQTAGNLPAQLTSFVNRRAEIGELGRLVSASGLSIRK